MIFTVLRRKWEHFKITDEEKKCVNQNFFNENIIYIICLKDTILIITFSVQ